MSVNYLQFLVAVIIFACIAIYGSGKRTSDELTPSQTVTKSSAEASSSNGTEAQRTRPVAKPGAAVKLKSAEPLFAAAPGVYEYQLQLVSSNHTGNMTVNVLSSDGVTIVSPDHQFEFLLQDNGEYILPLRLYANSEGRFYIQLHVSIVADEQSSIRVINAILQVGEPVVKAQKMVTKSAVKNVETVIPLPAQETISPR